MTCMSVTRIWFPLEGPCSADDVESPKLSSEWVTCQSIWLHVCSSWSVNESQCEHKTDNTRGKIVVEIVNWINYGYERGVFVKKQDSMLVGILVLQVCYNNCDHKSLFLLLLPPIYPQFSLNITWVAILVDSPVQKHNPNLLSTSQEATLNLLTCKSNYVLLEPLFSWFMTPAPPPRPAWIHFNNLI